MNNESSWTALGRTQELLAEVQSHGGLKEFNVNGKSVVLTYDDGRWGALHPKCNHMGGPLAKGRLKNGCVECPWHYWRFNAINGVSEESEASRHFTKTAGSVPSYPLREEGENLMIDMGSPTPREPAVYDMAGRLGRDPQREPGPLRVLGLSTTVMDPEHPRFSTSQELLRSALDKIAQNHSVETRYLALSDLKFRHCEGFYSKSERACTWPCSITKMDPTDEMSVVYENLVHWADVVIVATPIRWGNASSLYYKMAERLNSVQNQITLKSRELIQNNSVGLIVTGGQDNIQSVAGQMLTFFGELGFHTPAFPFVAHSLGWTSEDMNANMEYVKDSEYLHEESVLLIERCLELSRKLVGPGAEVSAEA